MTAIKAALRGSLEAIEYAGALGAAAALRALSLDAASSTMGLLWRTLGPLTPRHARAMAHLALALPELDDATRRRVAAGMWDNLGRVAAETMQIDRLAAEPGRIEIPDETLAILDRTRGGAVLVSLHAGNWEIVVRAAAAAGLVSTGVYKPLDNVAVDRWLRAKREPLYAGGLVPKSSEAARVLIGRVKAGQTIAVMADLRDSRGIQVPFFGLPAYANPFPAMVARMTGRPMVAGRVRRLDGVRFRVDAAVVPVAATDDRTADVAATTAALHAVFEHWIREAPEQWMWIHRKWDRDRSKRRARRDGNGDDEG